MKTTTMKLSVVSPVYRSSALVEELVTRIKQSKPTDFGELEIILVDDRSPDDSWVAIQKAAEKHPEVVGVRLSRNFGQHHAITAGLDRATGDWVVVMDCDLQDRPEEIPRLYEATKEGYAIVLARRENRADSFCKRAFSRLFYATLGYLSGLPQDATVANFGIYSRQVVGEISRFRESIRYFPTMVKAVGFEVGKINVEHAPRAQGETTYTFRKLMALGVDIILAHSDKPLRLVFQLGLFIAALTGLMGLVVVIRWLMGEVVVMGYASIIISIWFLGGMSLMTIGIIGAYVGKIFQVVKNRPIYIVDQIVGPSN